MRLLVHQQVAMGAVEGIFLFSSNTELVPVRLFRFYGARSRIEFAFRDIKQHLGLHDY